MGGVIFCAIISISSIGLVEYLLYLECLKIPLLIYAGGFPVWIVFFVLGIYWGKVSEKIKKRNYLILIFLTFVSLMLAVKETYFLLNYGCGGYGQKIFSFIFNTCVISLIFSRNTQHAFEILKTNIFVNTFAWIGRKSFFIYLIHCYFIGFIIPRIPLSFSWFSETVMVMVLSILSTIVAEKFPKKIQHYIGL